MKGSTSPPVKHSAVKRAADIISSPPAGSQGIKSSGMFDNQPPKIKIKKKSEVSPTKKLPTSYSIKTIRASLSSASKSKKRQDDDSDIESSSNTSDDVQSMMKREILELRLKVQSLIEDKQSASVKSVDHITPIPNDEITPVIPIEARKVSKREWTNTSQSISAFFLGNKITSMIIKHNRIRDFVRWSQAKTRDFRAKSFRLHAKKNHKG